MERPTVHPEVVRYLEKKIAPLELESQDDPESLMARALKRQGQLELIAILKSMTGN